MAEKYTLTDYTKATRIFPGATKYESDIRPLPAGALTDLFKIEGKGQILGGLVTPLFGIDQHDSIIYLYVDEILISAWKFEQLNQLGMYPPANFPLRLLMYDTLLHRYAVDLFAGINFEESFKIRYREGFGIVTLLYWQIPYALME